MYDKAYGTMRTVWAGPKFDASEYGTKVLQGMFGDQTPFDYPKSIEATREAVGAFASAGKCDLIVDYFCGSGTTGQVVLELRRPEASRDIKFLIADVGEHLFTAAYPRLQKVCLSTSWKDGKPNRDGKPHPELLQTLHLESYEDTLANLTLRRTPAQQAVLDADAEAREDYVLGYMLDAEAGESLLDVRRFARFEEYTLRVEQDGETRPQAVDLVETFNWLLGLRVHTLDRVRGVRVVTGTDPDGQKVLVLWRNTEGEGAVDAAALDAWFRKQAYNTQDQEYDLIYVNGDCHLENLRRPDQTWKVRLTEEHFHRLMFETEE